MTTHTTPVSYSATHAAEIRRQFAAGDGELTCPLCGAPLMFAPCIERKSELYSEIYCGECSRCVMVKIASETDGPPAFGRNAPPHADPP